MQLEDLTKGATVEGILPNQAVTVVDVNWFGTNAIELTYKDSSGHLDSELLYREAEPPSKLSLKTVPGALVLMALSCASSRKPTAFDWRTCLTPCWQFTLP